MRINKRCLYTPKTKNRICPICGIKTRFWHRTRDNIVRCTKCIDSKPKEVIPFAESEELRQLDIEYVRQLRRSYNLPEYRTAI